jgi:hypothetical protein
VATSLHNFPFLKKETAYAHKSRFWHKLVTHLCGKHRCISAEVIVFRIEDIFYDRRQDQIGMPTVLLDI